MITDLYNLQAMYADLMLDWDYSKNEIKPDEIEPYSNKRAYWKCNKCEHEWDTIINNRTSKGSGCPKCNKGSQTSYMEQAIYIIFKMKYSSTKNRYKTSNNFEYDILIPELNLAIEYNGRLYHSNAFNDDIELRNIQKREIAKANNIHLLNLNETYGNSGKPNTINEIYFNADNNYKLNKLNNLVTEINKQLNLDLEVPENIITLVNNEIIQKEKENSIGILYPELIKDWDTIKNGKLTPFMVAPKSNKPINWRCNKCEHEWITTPAHRTHDGTGCPKCNILDGKTGGSHLVVQGVNDLVTLRPDIAADWDYDKNVGIDINQITVKSNKRVYWKCKVCKGSYDNIVAKRTEGEGKCPYCSNRRVLAGLNDLKSANYELAMEFERLNKIDSSKILASTQKQALWSCKYCENKVLKGVAARLKHGILCNKCGNLTR